MTAGPARPGTPVWAVICMATAWIIALGMAAMGMTVHWPTWLMVASNTGMMAISSSALTSRARGLLMSAMAILVIVAAIGAAVTRH